MTEVIAQTRPFHPNHVTLCGLTLGCAAAVTACIEETRMLAPFLYTLGAGCDWADGNIARKHKLGTKEGALFDPLADKIRQGVIGGIMIYNECTNPWIVTGNIANFVVDYVSQAQRGPLPEQLALCYRGVRDPWNCAHDGEVTSSIRANGCGKVKAGIQAASHVAYLAYRGYREYLPSTWGKELDNAYLGTLSGALLVSAALGAIGVYRRKKVKTT